MKDILLNFLKKPVTELVDDYRSLSKTKKIFSFILAFIFMLTLFYGLYNYSGLIAELKKIPIVKYMISHLKGMPFILRIILGVIAVLIIYIVVLSKKTILPLEVINISILDKPDASSNIYEITLANNNNRKVFLKKLKVSWIYNAGECCSIGEGVVINSIANYILDIPLDVSATGKQSICTKMNPIIVLPAKDEHGPGFIQFQVQLYYHFIGDIKYHPQSDWDITFSLDVSNEKDRSFNIFNNYKWRNKEEIDAINNGKLSEYNEKLKRNYTSKHFQ